MKFFRSLFGKSSSEDTFVLFTRIINGHLCFDYISERLVRSLDTDCIVKQRGLSADEAMRLMYEGNTVAFKLMEQEARTDSQKPTNESRQSS